jgi:hypothetical protein
LNKDGYAFIEEYFGKRIKEVFEGKISYIIIIEELTEQDYLWLINNNIRVLNITACFANIKIKLWIDI